MSDAIFIIDGDFVKRPQKVSIELSNSIIYALEAKMSVVHDREGGILRVVALF